MNKQNNKINYTFDSKEEEYFYAWLLELYNIGYIDWIYPNKKTYCVINETLSTRMAKLKTKDKYELFILTKKREYTPDFIFKFNPKAYKIFYHDSKGGYENRPYYYCNNNRGIIYIDVKGGFNGNRKSDMIFPDRQSAMVEKFNIYVQKVIPYALGKKYINKETLFKKTFTPQIMINTEVYLNDRKNKWKKGDSKLKYKVTKLNEYLC
jgi:hypothetical protein